MTDDQSAAPTSGRPRFTPEQAREAGRRSGEARRRKKAERDAVAELAKAARLRALEGTAGALEPSAAGGEVEVPDPAAVARSERYDLRSAALAGANLLVDRVLTEQVAIRHAADLATLLERLHTIYRLESGESTSNTISLTLGSAAALEQLRTMRDDTLGGGDA